MQDQPLLHVNLIGDLRYRWALGGKNCAVRCGKAMIEGCCSVQWWNRIPGVFGKVVSSHRPIPSRAKWQRALRERKVRRAHMQV